MPQPTSYSATLRFGAQIDSSFEKSIQNIEKNLKMLGQDAHSFGQNLSLAGTTVLGLGTAFLGLRSGMDLISDLAEKGQDLADSLTDVHVGLSKLISLGGQTGKFESSLAGFNEQLRKASIYSTQISTTFQSGLIGSGFKDVSQIEFLTKRFELLAASQSKKLTPEDAQAAAANLATAVKGGGEGGVDALRSLGLSLSYADQIRYRSIQNLPGQQGVAYDRREKFIESLLQQQAPENAFGAARGRAAMAPYILGQEQGEFAGKLGLGMNTLFAPVENAITKALQGIEKNGELEKFSAWAQGAGERLNSFFARIIEPALPGALQALTAGLDRLGAKIEKIVEQYFPTEAEAKKREAKEAFGLQPKPALIDMGQVLTLPKRWFEGKQGPHSAESAVSPTSIYDTFPAFGSGGIVTSATSAIIGESGPEAVIPLSFLGAETKDITKQNTEATRKSTDALTALTQKLDDNLTFLQQQGQIWQLGQGGIGSGGAPLRRGRGAGGGPGNNVSGSIEGVKFTHYGYAGDSTPDYYSAHGIGDRENQLTEGLSVALTKSERLALFGYGGKSRGQKFTMGGHQWEDDDTAPESDRRVDVYDKSNSLLQQILSGNVRSGGKTLDAKSHLDDTLDRAEQALKLNTGRLDDPRIKVKTSGDTGSATPTVHYSPNVTLNINGHGHDANAIASSVKEALRVHGDELGRHIERVLQDRYRDHQRVNYA